MTYVKPDSSGLQGIVARLDATGFHVYKSVAQRLMNPRRRSRAAFLVGCGRSGTDLIGARLDESLEVTAVNESDPAAFENWRLRDLATVDQLVATSHGRLVLFKPIVETYRILELLRGFPDSRGLFVARHYGDTIHSIVSFFGERNREAVERWIETDFQIIGGWPVADETKVAAKEMYEGGASAADSAGVFWYVYNDAYRSLRLGIDNRVGLVLYDDLVREPEAELSRICEHLGIRYRRRMSRGIYASSLRAKRPPELHPVVKRHCEDLWDVLVTARSTPAALSRRST